MANEATAQFVLQNFSINSQQQNEQQQSHWNQQDSTMTTNNQKNLVQHNLKNNLSPIKIDLLSSQQLKIIKSQAAPLAHITSPSASESNNSLSPLSFNANVTITNRQIGG